MVVSLTMLIGKFRLKKAAFVWDLLIKQQIGQIYSRNRGKFGRFPVKLFSRGREILSDWVKK